MYELVGFNEERKRQESRRGRVWGIKELTGEIEKNGERCRYRILSSLD